MGITSFTQQLFSQNLRHFYSTKPLFVFWEAAELIFLYLIYFKLFDLECLEIFLAAGEFSKELSDSFKLRQKQEIST